MRGFLHDMISAGESGTRQLAVLIDPEDFDINNCTLAVEELQPRGVSYIFVGGSEVGGERMRSVLGYLKSRTDLPLIIFPGHPEQISEEADSLLFLSLLSGRNPEYLIGKHVEAAPILMETKLEVIPTAYILIGGNNKSAVERVTKTKPLDDHQEILHTAMAGYYLGMDLIYLEAGSGAGEAVDPLLISMVKSHIDLPLIVGGGIRTADQLRQAYRAGADLVVMGNIFETNPGVLNDVTDVMNAYARNY